MKTDQLAKILRETPRSTEPRSNVAVRPRNSSPRWGSNWTATGWHPR